MRLAPATPTAAGLVVGALLLAVYLLTLAPGPTLWDAGELIAAVHTVGIPHPPGTPLFVLAGRAWTLLFGWLPTAVASNLLSAASTAAACAILAALAARWTASAASGMAAGLLAGLMSSVWRNATETEVYALALLLAALILLAADRAGRTGEGRPVALLGYLLGLAVSVHVFALVVAPAAAVLAASGPGGALRRPRLAATGALAAIAAGAGTARPSLVVAGVLVLAVAAERDRPERSAYAASLGALVLALTPLAAMLVRSRLDPALDQGDPSTWAALLDVLARRQYEVAALWPRQAPPWLQLGNLVEWADWQVALSLAPEPPPSPGRTAVTVLFALLALHGARFHRATDRRSWRAAAVLALAASVGVVAYLNLKAGPSFGVGILPDAAPREARERDYFFVFFFAAWGLWAGIGAVALARRWGPRAAPAGVLVAALPAALNWSAVDRSALPGATIASDVASALLDPLPAGTVLLTGGDNDSYPLWYAQLVERSRPDVTVVVVPLLNAPWYREEMRLRHGLGRGRGEAVSGLPAAVRGVVAEAVRAGRPVAASGLLGSEERGWAGERWVLAGAHWLRAGDLPPAERVVEAGGMDVAPGIALRSLGRVSRQVGDGVAPHPSADPATRQMRRVLSCVPLAARAAELEPGLLASRCNRP